MERLFYWKRLIQMSRELSGMPIPQTLVHGDLNMSNVAQQEGHYLFYDWTDACVSHPFFDMFLSHVSGDLNGVSMSEVYFAPWQAWTDRETIDKIWTLSIPLCYLHYGVKYQSLVGNLPDLSEESKGEWMDDWHTILKFLGKWCREN
ncbi:MAG: phosphotransferase [Candidatus Latescibacteria bacterium]|nr:phosphotransferase [Candidatus Latescibacterota bacterium]